MRHGLVWTLVLLGTVCTLITEILGAWHLLRPVPLGLAWILAVATGCALLWRRRRDVRGFVSWPRLGWLDWLGVACVGAVCALVGLVAALSPPNSHDVLAYHMPRVVYWAQAGSVAFYPTQYLNQIMMAPLAEYMMLQTYVLSGGDSLVNLVQFVFFAGSIAGASLVAGQLGVGKRGQVITAIVCATLPGGILQASGAKNEWVLTFWLVAAVYFAFRYSRTPARADLIGMGLAVALAILTKGTAYLFAPAPLVAAFAPHWRTSWRSALRALPVVALLVAALNGPQYWRNIDLSGSPLGFDSAHADGRFRWRNERFGLRPTISNLLRHVSDQVGSDREAWNRAVFGFVLDAHRRLGIDPNDPATTWYEAEFEPPRSTNHEADANNRWHLLLLVLSAVAMSVTTLKRGDLRWTAYWGGLVCAFLLFCFYLKWIPYQARMAVPLMVLGSPIAGAWLERLRPRLVAVAACVLLLANSRLCLTENWLRRLEGPGNLFETTREQAYFNDMAQWNNAGDFVRAAELTASSGCRDVGIDATYFQLEYPFQALVLRRNPAVRFQHTGVTNPSARYRKADAPRPCAVLCLDCAGVSEKLEEYGGAGEPVTIGQFVLFLSSEDVGVERGDQADHAG